MVCWDEGAASCGKFCSDQEVELLAASVETALEGSSLGSNG